MSFPAYPTYRDSGIDWLGVVPSDWVVAGLKHRFNIVGGSTPKSDAPEYWGGSLPWITPADLSKVKTRFITQTIRSITEAGLMSCGTTLAPPDSLVLSTRAPIGSLAITAVEACTNQGCKALVPLKGADSTFAFYALSVATEQLNLRGKGTTFLELSSDELGAFSLAFPLLPEQRSIAAFLDRETAKIDALVEEQRRLIALLKEKRQAVISHAVTKGLNPDAPMKNSGVEWLGEVPAHWDVLSVGRVCDQISYGFTNPMPTDEAGPFMLTANDIGDREVRYDSARRTTQEAFDKLLTDKSRPRAGDVLLTKDGTLGRIAIADGRPACINQSVAFLRPSKEVGSEFIAHALADGIYFERMIYEAGGTTIKHIYISRLAKMPFARPPKDEATAIAEECERRLRQANQMIGVAEEGIGLLLERRAALISAAVTGKLDVRETASVVSFPVDRARARGLIAAEIIERSARQATFGRVKLQKIVYLAEAHAGVSEVEGAYLREAAGPLDREMIREMEREAGVLAGVRVEQPDGAGSVVTYRLGDRRGAYRQDLALLLGDRAAKFDKLVEDVGTLDTKGAEAVATLYAVWNDALIDGETPADMEIKLAVQTEWHPEKAKKFRLDELQIWLDWMRRHGLVPKGTGPRTSTGRLFA